MTKETKISLKAIIFISIVIGILYLISISPNPKNLTIFLAIIFIVYMAIVRISESDNDTD